MDEYHREYTFMCILKVFDLEKNSESKENTNHFYICIKINTQLQVLVYGRYKTGRVSCMHILVQVTVKLISRAHENGKNAFSFDCIMFSLLQRKVMRIKSTYSNKW